MPRRRPTPVPAGPYVGEPGEEPAWDAFPPQPRHFLNQGGFTYVAMYGNTGAARTDGPRIYFNTADAMVDYQEGAPGGLTGSVAFDYSCVWRRVNVAKKPVKPAAKRSWEDLSPSTRSGYRAPMRKYLGLTTEEQFKHYYETAPDLGLLRRHKNKRTKAPGLGRISFPRQGDLDPPPWLITWRKS